VNRGSRFQAQIGRVRRTVLERAKIQSGGDPKMAKEAPKAKKPAAKAAQTKAVASAAPKAAKAAAKPAAKIGKKEGVKAPKTAKAAGKVVPAAAKKAPAKSARAKAKKVSKGDRLYCEVCGLVVSIDDACGCAACDIICCDTQMQAKK